MDGLVSENVSKSKERVRDCNSNICNSTEVIPIVSYLQVARKQHEPGSVDFILGYHAYDRTVSLPDEVRAIFHSGTFSSVSAIPSV
jgi:hypothetical protein